MTNKASTGNRSTGDYSTGDRSTGDYSAGYRSTGNCSTGDYSTGDCSTGYRSAGNYSTGDYSTGDYSISDRSSGHFSTESEFKVFDLPCLKSDWDDCEKPFFLYFKLTLWVNSSDMTNKEKEENENHVNTGGYLKVLDYKEAFKGSYNKASELDKKKIFNIPNFNADKFLEISGIDVRIDNDLAIKKAALIEKANELLDQANQL